jgi:hypothetical protein
MQFLKKHYEKIVLGVVLLAVAAIALLLVMSAGAESQRLADQLQKKVAGSKKPVKPTDLSAGNAALEHLGSRLEINLAGDHKTFNPNTWLRKVDGTIAPVTDNGSKGARGLVLTATHPLNLSIAYTAVAGTGDPYRYQFTVVRDHEKLAAKRRPSTVSLTEGAKNDLFLLREVHGPKDNPTEVVIELIEGGDRATLTKEKPFAKGLAFSADLRYELENKTFAGKRADETVTLSGTPYKIVAIDADAIVVSAPNKVRSTIKLSGTP